MLYFSKTFDHQYLMCISCACSSWVMKRSEAVICFGRRSSPNKSYWRVHHKVQLRYNVGYPIEAFSDYLSTPQRTVLGLLIFIYWSMTFWHGLINCPLICRWHSNHKWYGCNTCKTQERPWASKVGVVDHRISSLTVTLKLQVT